MAKKLFSFEEFDEEVGGAEGDLEVTPESGEAADVLAEITEDNAEITEIAESAEEGIDAADELEDVAGDLQESLGDTVEVDEETGEETVVEGDGEGISAEASRQYQKRIASIMKRVGANPKAIYSIYAKENFESASSRRANTRIALEGVADALKDLWERIKAAIKAMWKKIKDFWNKHLSTVGRLEKAVKEMQRKVNKLKDSGKKGIVSGKRTVPASLLATFPVVEGTSAESSGVFNIDHILNGTANFDNFGKDVINVLNFLDQINTAIGNNPQGPEAIAAAFKNSNSTIKFGDEKLPLVGGTYITIDVEIDDDYRVEVTRETETVDKTDKEMTLEVVSKDQLKKLLEASLKGVKVLKEVKKKIDTSNSKYEDVEVKMNKAILNGIPDGNGNTNSTAGNVSGLSIAARVLSQVNVKLAPIGTLAMSLAIREIKGHLQYANIWVKATNKIQ